MKKLLLFAFVFSILMLGTTLHAEELVEESASEFYFIHPDTIESIKHNVAIVFTGVVALAGTLVGIWYSLGALKLVVIDNIKKIGLSKEKVDILFEKKVLIMENIRTLILDKEIIKSTIHTIGKDIIDLTLKLDYTDKEEQKKLIMDKIEEYQKELIELKNKVLDIENKVKEEENAITNL